VLARRSINPFWLTAAYKSVAADASIGISFGVDAGVWRNAPSGA